MVDLAILRLGNPYNSLEIDSAVHFITGEPIAKVSQANGGLLQRDMRKAPQAREALRGEHNASFYSAKQRAQPAALPLAARGAQEELRETA